MKVPVDICDRYVRGTIVCIVFVYGNGYQCTKISKNALMCDKKRALEI